MPSFPPVQSVVRALKILKDNGFSAMTDMDEAVQKAVQLATKGQGRAA